MSAVKMKCRVCSRNATGVHYGVMACEGCKAFYRRGVEKNIKFQCYFGNKCTTRPNTRANCKSCRFDRCKVLGMKLHGPKRREEKTNVPDPAVPLDQELEFIDENMQTPTSITENVNPNSATPMDLREFISIMTPSSSSGSEDFFAEFPQTVNNLESSLPSITSDVNDDIFENIQLLPDMANNLDVDENLIDSTLWEVLDRQQAESSEDQPIFLNSPSLLTFMNGYMRILDENGRRMVQTVEHVALSIDAVFGDQIRAWTLCMDQGMNFAETPLEPEANLETMLDALRYHNSDSVARILRFASIIPGTAELDIPAQSSVTVGWKWMAFWLVHHANFLTDQECFVTMGPEQRRYSRYWQDRISEKQLLAFNYKFCAKFREIGLNQTETYMLLAVIFFEPGQQSQSTTRSSEQHYYKSRLELIHRHYTDVLFDSIKRRCGDAAKLAETCRKLEEFFGALRLVHRIHRHYLRKLDLTVAPFRAIKDNHVITVQEALTCNEGLEDPEEFDLRSPMTYKIRKTSISL